LGEQEGSEGNGRQEVEWERKDEKEDREGERSGIRKEMGKE